jgi:hypothetical protein
VLLRFVTVPEGALPIANALVAILFLGAPILALFFAARGRWSPKLAGLFVALGVALQVGFALLAVVVLGPMTLLGQIALAISQIGLPIWCVGLGALLATLVKDKNILIPIAIFLAVYDMFLVLTPGGPTQEILKHAPQVFESVAMAIPAVQSQATGGRVEAMAHAGPADFVFLSMFFIALFRFRMRTDQTLRWMIPVLLVYLLLTGVLGMPLPALVPIGATVLLVNWREFKMTRDELVSTIVVAALGVGLLAWGASRPKPPAEPSPRADAQGAPRSEGLPEQAPSDRRR